MKRIFIVHGWGGSPQRNWMPWAKQELETLGYEVNIPIMPDTEHPQMEKWVSKLAETVGKPIEDIILIGHSLGCITILRYLETLPENQKVGSVILVAGFTSDDLNTPELKNFFTTPINFAKIKQKAQKFTAIHSDNDPYVSLKHADIFREDLGMRIILEKEQGHFTENTLPILLDLIQGR